MSKRQFRSKTAYLGQPRDKGGRWAGKGSPRGKSNVAKIAGTAARSALGGSWRGEWRAGWRHCRPCSHALCHRRCGRRCTRAYARLQSRGRSRELTLQTEDHATHSDQFCGVESRKGYGGPILISQARSGTPSCGQSRSLNQG